MTTPHQHKSTTSSVPPVLPAPYATPSAINFASVVGWPAGVTPTAPAGFTVTRWAGGLDYPRWFHLLPNGDVLVSEARSVLLRSHDRQDPGVDGGIRSRSLGESANRITLLRDADGDGIAEFRAIFLEGLDRPFGMALLGDRLYVGATDGVFVFPYRSGQSRLEGPGEKILELPAGGYNNHWTRNVAPGPGGTKLYVTVGSASNVGEYGMAEEERRAGILEIDSDGSHERIFASGLRNAVGLDWEPVTRAMRLAEVLALAEPLPAARFVRVGAGTYSLPLALAEAGEALLADELDAQPLALEHGAPWRLILPGGACYTSVKWVDRLELVADPGRHPRPS